MKININRIEFKLVKNYESLMNSGIERVTE